MDCDDPILEEHKVFVSTQLASYLTIIQHPGGISELEGESITLTGRFKKTHKILELEVPLDTTHPTYSSDRGEELAVSSHTGRIHIQGDSKGVQGTTKLTTLQLAGSRMLQSKDSNYFVGIYVNGTTPLWTFITIKCLDTLHLTPVECFINMRPTLKYLDESDARTKTAAKRLEGDQQVGLDKPKVLQVQFKKRETEEQIAARLSSYAYLQRQVEEESWTELTHFLPNTAESRTVSERLCAATTQVIDFKHD